MSDTMSTTATQDRDPYLARHDGTAPRRADFPAGFLWGCATSSYQI
jgi:hypothetical protein